MYDEGSVMRRFYREILGLKESQMRDTIWYSLGSICSSGASMIILLIVTRIMGPNVSGVFSLAWSAAQLMLTVGWFSTRQYQVSDVQDNIGYNEYRVAKIISSVAMFIIGWIYVSICNYEVDTRIITILLCFMMMMEVFGDFYSGFFQRKGKLYLGGISYVIRNILYILTFFVSLLMFRKLLISIVCAVLIQLLWLLVFDVQLAKQIPIQRRIFRWKNVLKLFVDCLPLFVGSFITSYIMNIPKNAINQYMDYQTQASYNILFMPTAVINMFNLFICVPFYSKLAVLWQQRKQKEFLNMLYKIVGFVVGITVVSLLGGVFWGIPVLEWLYGIELAPYCNAFFVLILGGGFNGILSVLIYVVTVFRKQQIITYIYVMCAVFSQIIVGNLVQKSGMLGAAMSYTMALGIACVGMVLYIVFYLKKKGEKSA